ncbi:hemerythrin domain-containing protein [Azospirillum canadense]|uniref:hemerythrin domain-containing protein n=1 Tax=Azospirillum canadense TaxID=403962 RepID=UPI00222691E3|nr:hemerythrin domain-containing protein [Azospirillum canadense]MCW2239204.1 hemerythrin-like domain-containing protein [Azospirillum canadense]
MTIAQQMQESLTKVNELFSRLADTSNNAVKTRERLFSELKEELETHATLEEKHLFPVLRKHKETKDLVADAINDIRQVRSLLSDLDRMPKDNEDFATKVAELKKVFQQHVRDERKELLPAVRKALSDEEAQTVSERLEAGRIQIESQRRAEEAERAQAAEEAQRRSLREASIAMMRPVETAAIGGEQVLRTGGVAARAAADMAQEGTRQTAGVAGQATQQATATLFETARRLTDLAQPNRAAIDALAAWPTALGDALRDTSETWMIYTNRTADANTRVLQCFARGVTPLAVAEAHSRYLRDTVEAMVEAGTRLAEISMRTTQALSQSATGAGRSSPSGRDGGLRQISRHSVHEGMTPP